MLQYTKRGEYVAEQERERVILVFRREQSERGQEFQSRVDEMVGLCDAANAQVIMTFDQERSSSSSSLYLGSGKVIEIAEVVEREEISVVVFDAELSPAQVRNLENRLVARVVDRTQLILDIFALRAKSREGRLQVEIAQLEYLLPRLSGRGVMMSRLGAGIGTRGPGETKLEMDKRRIRKRISILRSSLKDVRGRRQVQRDKRAKSVPTVALVGYTNAGKTSLLQKWTDLRGVGHTGVGHERLFDTLDPLARRVKAGTTADIVVMDTVGFVRNLPHMLVDAFRSTLEEALAADVIVHVVDATADAQTQMTTTYRVLSELGTLDKPVVTFFNKMDIENKHPGPDTQAFATVYGSVETGENLDMLFHQVDLALELDPVHLVIEGRADNPTFWADVAKSGRVVESDEIEGHQIRLKLQVERRLVPRVQERIRRLQEVVEVELAEEE